MDKGLCLCLRPLLTSRFPVPLGFYCYLVGSALRADLVVLPLPETARLARSANPTSKSTPPCGVTTPSQPYSSPPVPLLLFARLHRPTADLHLCTVSINLSPTPT